MAFLIPTNAVQIARFANGLYGLQLGFASTNGIVSDVGSAGLLPTFNNYYTLSFGSQTTASVAQQILTNLGIVASTGGLSATAVSAALAYVTGQLNAAAPAARGAAVKAVFDLWSTISADPVNGPIYGTTAATWNSQISKAVQYAGAVNPDLTVAAAAALPVPPQTFALTTGTDAFTTTGTGAGTANITGSVNGGTATFTPGDSITGTLTTVSLNLSDLGSGGTVTPNLVGGATITGVTNFTLSSAEKISMNTTTSGGAQGWTGLTSESLTGSGGEAVTAAATTSVTTFDSALAAGSVTVTGGNAVNITSNGSTTGTITVSKPAGAVTINNAQAIASTGTGGNIAVTGGTVVTVSSTNSGLTTNTGATEGNIAVTGTATTTTVSVTQSADLKTGAAVAASATAAAVSAAAGNILGTVTIKDANATSATTANTITTVSITNANTVAINSNALTTLTLAGNLTGGATAVTITNAASPTTNTTLTLNLNGVNVSSLAAINNTQTQATIVDTNNEITTINAVLTGNSTIAAITDTGLKTLNLSGTGVLFFGFQGANNLPTTLTALTLTGAAGLNATAIPATVTTISAVGDTAVQNFDLIATTQSFTGGAGQDIIWIANDATKTITAGSATNNELVLNASGATFTAANTVKNVTGFTTIGTNSGSSGTYDLSVLTGFNAIDVMSGTGTVAFSKVGAAVPLTIDGNATSVTITNADSNGATDIENVIIGTTGTADAGGLVAVTVGTLALKDAASIGLGTVNITSQAITGTVGAVNTITTLTDNALAALSLTGNAGLIVTNTVTTSASTLALNVNDTSTAVGLTLGSLTANTMTNLNITGSNLTTITTLTDSNSTLSIVDSASKAVTFTTATVTTGTTLSVTNSGSAALTIPTLTDGNEIKETFVNSGTGTIVIGATAHAGSALTSLTYTGNVTDTVTGIPGTAATTVSAATNNSPVSITITGITAAGITNTITLGNGVDTVVFNVASVGTHNVTLGNGIANTYTETATIAGGANLTLGSGSTTVSFGAASTDTIGFINVTAAAHSAANTIIIGNAGTSFATTPNLIYTGAQPGDIIKFSNDNGLVTAQGNVTPLSTLNNTLTAMETLSGGTAHLSAIAVFGGNTYVSESATATNSATVTNMIEIVGTHTFTITGGNLVLLT